MRCSYRLHLTHADARFLEALGIAPWACPRCEQIG